MKKTFYIAPAIEVSTIEAQNICVGTIVDAQAGNVQDISVNSSETPEGLSGDSRRASVWGDMEAEEDW